MNMNHVEIFLFRTSFFFQNIVLLLDATDGTYEFNAISDEYSSDDNDQSTDEYANASTTDQYSTNERKNRCYR